ncbi:MAG TPA: inorganic phosphate transporter [Bacteroidaceae bacterium]|nr:inorganic phosphate transporter [Bacteroidaceae bacterium]
METFYLGVVIFLFGLAVFDLVVGVSNDAVNFLNSAVGSKVAKFKVILIIAAMGVLIGAGTSNGMMEIARNGVFVPEHYHFNEIMTILVAVMLTDVVLLDLFNTMGLPTSTTVSMVFELLGGTCALAVYKASHGGPALESLINTDKALTMIIGIFLSVAVAFFFGMVVQWIARVIFSFSYKKNLKYTIGLFGGFATAAIVYFIVFKGFKKSTFMTADLRELLIANTWEILLICFVGATVLMQILHWLKVNVFKIIVLMGTFSLALAFAGNDLVNFIGVPLAGYSSYKDVIKHDVFNQKDGYKTYKMTSLSKASNTEAQRIAAEGGYGEPGKDSQVPMYFLLTAGAIMVVALATSKKAHNVIKTSVDLSRQDEGDESFGSTPMARTLVRISMNIARGINCVVPESAREWLDSRFRKDEAILEDGAAFDLVRASVNLILAGVLIIVGTSMKLPLSTTYVTFMVAMGSSLSDKAWGRESAVFRITGVLSVVGGWFITAGAAFTICFIVAGAINLLGPWALAAFIAIAIFSLVRSQLVYKKRKTVDESEVLLKRMKECTNEEEQILLLRKYTRMELAKRIENTAVNYHNTIDGFAKERIRPLRRTFGSIRLEKKLLNQMKHMGTSAVSRLGNDLILQKGLYYYQSNDFASELIYSMIRLAEPCVEHIDNNFSPLSAEQLDEYQAVSERIYKFMLNASKVIASNEYDNVETLIEESNQLNAALTHIKREQLRRIQSTKESIKLNMVYLNMIQETNNLVTYSTHLLKVSPKFQLD